MNTTRCDSRRSAPTAVIAEDEPLLADELRERLSALWPELGVAGTANDGAAALLAIQQHAPDVAFLDIRMPLMSGLEVARRIHGVCHIVFISAYDQHAIEAFEAGGLDYVLKPLSSGRLALTVERVKSRIASTGPDLLSVLDRLAATATGARQHLQWINASRGNAVQLITVDEIQYFQADSKYTLVVTSDGEALIRRTIKELTEQLDPTIFWQVHRSTIVNVHFIDRVQRDHRGNMALQIKGRTESLPVSVQYHVLFRQM